MKIATAESNPDMVRHVVKIAIAESNPDMVLFTQQIFSFSPNLLAEVRKTPVMRMSVASDQGLDWIYMSQGKVVTLPPSH